VSLNGIVKAGQVNLNGIVKYVGMGFTPANQSAGEISVDGNTVHLCYMARKGRGPNGSLGTVRACDGGCTRHMSGETGIWVGKRKKLSRPTRIKGFDSASRDDKGAIATDVGTIRLPCTRKGKESTVEIKNVLYVPAMGNITLVSQGLLDDQRFQFTVGGGVTTCYDRKGRLLWEAPKRGGLYQFGSFEQSFMTKDEAHVKFGHIGEKLLAPMGDFDGPLSA
jgi:hypothetical protein